MTHDDFEKFVQETIFPRIFNTVVTKGREYETSENRFGNFLRLAEFNKVQPVTIIQSLVSKHILSLRDMIHELETAGAEFDIEVYEEKIFDILTYHCLMYGMLAEEANIPQVPSVQFIHPHCPSCGVIGGAKHIEGCSATKDYTAHVTRQDIAPESIDEVCTICGTINNAHHSAMCVDYRAKIKETLGGWVKRLNKGIHRQHCETHGCDRYIQPADEFYERTLGNGTLEAICCACHDQVLKETETHGD